MTGPLGINIIPAGSGVRELTKLNEEQRLQLVTELEDFDLDFDVFLIDTGAGISDNVLFFCSAAQEVVVIATPEPDIDCRRICADQSAQNDFKTRHFRLIVNTARSEKEAFDTYSKLSLVADKFLNLPIDYLGYLPFDPAVKDSIIARKVILSCTPTVFLQKSWGR